MSTSAPIIFDIVSIHASREGRDSEPAKRPRTPPWFQSTRPVKDATVMFSKTLSTKKFQSTRPVKDATSQRHRRNRLPGSFNPRVP